MNKKFLKFKNTCYFCNRKNGERNHSLTLQRYCKVMKLAAMPSCLGGEEFGKNP